MKRGVAYNQEAAQTVRLISLVIPPIMGLYTSLIVLHVFPSSHVFDPIVALGIAILWIVLSLYLFFRPITHRIDIIVRLGLIHGFTLASFIFIMGFNQPFIALFLLLFFVSEVYFGKKGFIMSALALVLAAGLDVFIRYRVAPDVILQNSLAVVSVIIAGMLIDLIFSNQRTRHEELVHSQARERLQYDRVLAIMNNLSDAAFSTNEKGTILMYNAASLDLLDTNDDLKGRSIDELFHLTNTDDVEVHLFDILKQATRTTRRDDLSHSYEDGESIRLEMTLSPIRGSYSLTKKREEQGGYIIIMRDVTKQKSLEEERDEFISVVSHELRTPITIVEGSLSNLQVLAERAGSVDPKVLADTIETAHDQVMYLATMVNDLSTLSRAERGVADAPEEIDVAELLHATHQQYEKEAAKRKLHLNLDLSPSLGKVQASRLYLEELLQNFVTNALKYTNEGSVTIIARRTKGAVTFTIKDTGIGISRSDQQKVFHKFYRSEDYRIRETNGTGLGLYVASKLAHKLHTKIELKSRLNHGSAFSFELPAE